MRQKTPIADSFLPDELQLARLVCARLGGMMQGALTMGLASVRTESGSTFLTHQQKKHAAFIEVLNCISAKPSGQRIVEQLRVKTEDLATASNRFFSTYLRLAQRDNLSARQIAEIGKQLVAAYEAFLYVLQEVAELLELRQDFERERLIGQQFLPGFLELANQEAPAVR